MGLSLGTRTLNQGPAQAALDGLAEPFVDVVPLELPGGGAHLELLGYRGAAESSRLGLQVRDVAATRLVWKGDKTTLIRDPDGHLHQLCAVA